MCRQITPLFGTALLGLAHAQRHQITTHPGPQFTAAPGKVAKRQDNAGRSIAINQEYEAPIGVDTQYPTMDGSTTKVYYSGISMILNPCDTYTVQD